MGEFATTPESSVVESGLKCIQARLTKYKEEPEKCKLRTVWGAEGATQKACMDGYPSAKASNTKTLAAFI